MPKWTHDDFEGQQIDEWPEAVVEKPHVWPGE
jgi:hypothetical protein